MKQKLEKLFICWLVFIPFIIWRGYYEGPKVIYFYAGSFFIFLFWIIRFLKYKKPMVISKTDFLFLTWLLLLFISGTFGVHPFESLVGGSYRHQGVIFFLALWVVAKTVQILPGPRREWLSKMFKVVVISESILVIWQKISGNVYFGNSLGTMGEANAIAGFLAAGVIIANVRSFLEFGVVLIAVSLTGSKIGLFSFVLASTPFLAEKLGRKYKPVILITALFSSLVLSGFVLGPKARYFFMPVRQLWRLAQEDRVLIWRLAGEKIRQRWVLGWGAESSEVVFENAYREAGMPLLGIMVDRAHNLFLDILIWSGTVGLVVFLGWLGSVFRNLPWKKKMGFLALLAYAMFQPLSIVHWLLFFLII
jgi:O-antigen ligase